MYLAVSTSLLVAGVGAAGVLLAGLVASLTKLRAEDRRAKREERGHEEGRARELRLAVRLVVEELSEAERLIREAARAGHYWPAGRRLSHAVWAEHKATLASNFSGPADWQAIRPAFSELNRLNWLVAERRDRRGIGDIVPVEAGDDTRVAWYEVQRAIWGLEASIDMADDVATWLRQTKHLEQSHWGDSLQEDISTTVRFRADAP